jgi:hypothetical protein
MKDNPSGQVKSYVDKYGHPHSEAVVRHWHPKALKALGVRRVRPPTQEEPNAEQKKGQAGCRRT